MIKKKIGYAFVIYRQVPIYELVVFSKVQMAIAATTDK